MHILLINHEYPPTGGGAASASLHVAHELVKRGVRVTVLTSAFSGCARSEHEGILTVLRIPALRRREDRSNPFEMLTFLLSSLWWVIRYGRQLKPDVCIAFFGIPGGVTAWLLKKLFETPYIISLRGGDVPGFLPQNLRLWHSLTAGLIRFLWRQSAAVVANSQGLATVARSASPKQHIDIISNGVNTDTFYPTGIPPLPNAPIRLVCTGRLNTQKNLSCLLQALAPLQKMDWTLCLIGDGPEREALLTQAQALGLADKLIMSGWVSRQNLPTELRQADIFVFPSIQEGMPNAVLEAMASGLPVIACSIEGCEEIVRNGETGFLVPPNSASALTTALTTMLDNAILRKNMGRAGRKLVCREYAWSHTAEEYWALCQRTLSHKLSTPHDA